MGARVKLTHMIDITDVTKSYGVQKALDAVSLRIGSGQVVGLLGPNGAGKSTLMKITCGIVRADAGRVSVCGHDVEQEPEEVHKIVGFLPELNPLYPEMYVREYLTMVAASYGIADKRSRVESLIELTGLQPESHKLIGALSKGYRQRVGIAQALIGDPKVVILDEPMSGLDPNQLLEVRQLIRSLADERTVVLSTHIMQEVEAVCDHIVIIDHGHIKAQGAVRDILVRGRERQSVEVEYSRPVEPSALAAETGSQVTPAADGALVCRDTHDEEGQRDDHSEDTDRDDLRLRLFRFAVKHDNPIMRLAPLNDDLEELFHRLTTNA